METILFIDIDGTIVDNRFSYRAIGDLLGQVASVSGATIEMHGRELYQENKERQENDPNNPLTMDWDDIVATIASRYGVTLPETVLDLWQRYTSADEVDIFDDSPSVIKALKAPHRKLVIATKGLSKYQMPLLDVVGMTSLFDDILTPDITGYLKTEPEYYTKYTQDPVGKIFIHIGDHYYDDVICPKRNGFYSILRAPGLPTNESDPFKRPADIKANRDSIGTYPEDGTDILPDAVVLSLQELPQVIEAIEQKVTPH